MNDQTTSQQAGFYLTRWAACVPLVAMLLPTDFLASTFYPIVIWCVMLFAVVSGYGREIENTDPTV